MANGMLHPMRLGITGTVGVLFLLGGIAQLLKAIFGIDIPLFQTVFALALIYAGIALLFARKNAQTPWQQASGSKVLIGRENTAVSPLKHGEQSILAIGAISTIDLTALNADNNGIELHIQCIAAHVTLILRPSVPLCIEARAAIADCSLPDGNTLALGTLVYRSPHMGPEQPVLSLRITAAFSVVRFVHVVENPQEADPAKILVFQPVSYEQPLSLEP